MTDKPGMTGSKKLPPQLSGDITDSEAQRSLQRVARFVGMASRTDLEAVNDPGGPLGNPGPENAFQVAHEETPLAHASARIPDEMERPIPMLLNCPFCSHRHIDEGIWATKPHHTHACQNCGQHFRPAIVPTVGVKFLPGCKNG